MIGRVRAEWFLLRRRPLVLVLLGAFLVLLALQMLAQIGLLTVMGGSLADVQQQEFARRVLFPGVFGAVFGHVNGIGGVIAVILTAGAFGSEYGWGTLRLHLSRQPARLPYLAAKLLAVLLLIVVGMSIALVVGSLLGPLLSILVPTALLADSGSYLPDPVSLLSLIPALGRALAILLPYMLLTAAATLLGRSVLAGVLAGVLVILTEAALGSLALFITLSPLWQALYRLLLGPNINTLALLNAHTFGLRPETVTPGLLPEQMPPLWQALVVVCVYSISFAATGIWAFLRRDIER